MISFFIHGCSRISFAERRLDRVTIILLRRSLLSRDKFSQPFAEVSIFSGSDLVRTCLDHVDHLTVSVIEERRQSDQQEIEDDTSRPNVTTLVVLSFQNLRTDVEELRMRPNRTLPARVCLMMFELVSWTKILLSPKSISFSWLDFEVRNNMFSGLMSLCMMPRLCKYWIAFMSCRK